MDKWKDDLQEARATLEDVCLIHGLDEEGTSRSSLKVARDRAFTYFLLESSTLIECGAAYIGALLAALAGHYVSLHFECFDMFSRKPEDDTQIWRDIKDMIRAEKLNALSEWPDDDGTIVRALYIAVHLNKKVFCSSRWSS